MMRRLLWGAALAGGIACAAPVDEPVVQIPRVTPVRVSAWWPSGFGRMSPGTDTTTLCAWVSMSDGSMRRGNTAVIARRERGDSISFTLRVETGAQLNKHCTGPKGPHQPVEWHMARSESNYGKRWVPHPTLAPVKSNSTTL